MNGSSVETLSNTLRGSKKHEKTDPRLQFAFLSWWCVIHYTFDDQWLQESGKKRTFLFFPESCFLIFWFWVDFYDLWWCVSFLCDCLWLRKFEKVTYFSSWFRKLARYGWWNSTLCPNDLDVVPMTWMLSQVGQYPELSQLLHSMFQPQKGKKKTLPTKRAQEKLGGIFCTGDGNPHISSYVISNSSCNCYLIRFYICIIHIICQN